MTLIEIVVESDYLESDSQYVVRLLIKTADHNRSSAICPDSRLNVAA